MAIHALRSDEHYAQVLARHEPVILFKHSTTCGASFLALQAVLAFARQRADTPIFLIDVIQQRPLSESIARALSITHESPQVILVHHGRAVWSASRGGVSVEGLIDATERTCEPLDARASA